MRSSLLVVFATAALATACAGGGDDNATDDTDGTTDTADETTSADRLGVPEDFKFLWNTTDGCDTADGAPGVQVYWHTDDAESIVQGDTYTMTATETWYWFHGGSGSADCKDVFELRATWVTTDYDTLGCSTCEEGWRFERTLVDQGCQYGYAQIFGYEADEDPPEDGKFQGFFLIDSHNANGGPNENNKILLLARYRTPRGLASNNNYNQPGMSERVVDDPAQIGPPGGYTWVGESCFGSGDGGGGT